jgi:hypothetical protein
VKTSTPECVPIKASGPLEKFRHQLGASEWMVLDVNPPQWTNFNFCYPNAVQLTASEGGTVLTGWKIWHWPRVWFHAVHHAVWLKPNRDVIDVTPQENGADKTFFARRDELTFDPQGLTVVRDRYKLLWNHKKLERLLGVIKKRDELIAENRVLEGGVLLPTYSEVEMQNLIDEARPLWDWVKSNRKAR